LDVPDDAFDGLAVQGPAAVGHRGTLDPVASPPTQPLAQLLRATTAGWDVPVIDAGGLRTAVDVADVMAYGAVAAQMGTAFLLADAPFGYPEIQYMASPLRAAAVRAGDPPGTNVWAGTGFQKAKAASVADIMSALA
jgi:nitronate monooxygenase